MANRVVTFIKKHKLKIILAATTFVVGAVAAGGITAALIFGAPALIPIFAGKIALDIAVIAAATVVGGLALGLLPLLPSIYNAIAAKSKNITNFLKKFFTPQKAPVKTIYLVAFWLTIIIVLLPLVLFLLAMAATAIAAIIAAIATIAAAIVAAIAAILVTIVAASMAALLVTTPFALTVGLLILAFRLSPLFRLQKDDIWNLGVKTTFMAGILGTLTAALLFAAAPTVGATVVGALGLPATIILLITASILVGGLVSLADQYTSAKIKPTFGSGRAILFMMFNLLPRTLLIAGLLAGLTAGITFGAAPAVGALIVATFTSLPAFISVLVVSALAIGFVSSLFLTVSEWGSTKLLSLAKPQMGTEKKYTADVSEEEETEEKQDQHESLIAPKDRMDDVDAPEDAIGSKHSAGFRFFESVGTAIGTGMSLLTCCVENQEATNETIIVFEDTTPGFGKSFSDKVSE